MTQSNYINNRINDKITSKIIFHTQEVKHYFTHRHTGLAGIDNEMVASLVHGAIRDVRVWREMNKRNNFYSSGVWIS